MNYLKNKKDPRSYFILSLSLTAMLIVLTKISFSFSLSLSIILNLTLKEGCRCPSCRLLPLPPGPHPAVILPDLTPNILQPLYVGEWACAASDDITDQASARYEATAPLSGVCGQVHGRGATLRLSTVKPHTPGRPLPVSYPLATIWPLFMSFFMQKHFMDAAAAFPFKNFHNFIYF